MEFKWLNESEITIEGERIEIVAPAQTDFFCGSMDECEEGILPESLCNAPFYYTEEQPLISKTIYGRCSNMKKEFLTQKHITMTSMFMMAVTAGTAI